MKARILEPSSFPLQGMALIEASAGTGKTYTIANLYLRLLLGHGTNRPLTVDRILVVTFTIAATEELRERVRQRIVLAYDAFVANRSADDFINDLLQTCPDRGFACAQLDAARRQMDEAAIFTIHGFCHRALVDNAFESGLGFELDMVTDETLLLQQAAEDFWRSHVATLDAASVELLPGDWKSPAALLSAIRPYLSARPLELEPQPDWSPTNIRSMGQSVAEVKQLWLSDGLADLLLAMPFNKGSKYVRDPGRIEAMQGFCQSSASRFLYNDESWELWSHENLRAALPKARKDHLAEHRAFELCGELAESFVEAGNQLRLYLLHAGIAFISDSMRRAKEQLGQLSPDDLLTRLEAALRHADGGDRLAGRLADKYPRMLVDEFQDTDSIQYGIFEAIHSARSDAGWIMIGDPKQAIYKFRGADVFTYIHARKQVIEGAGNLYTLAKNWRSSAALVAAVNALFEGAAQSPGGAFIYSEDIPFNPVVASDTADSQPLVLGGRSPVALQFAYCRGEGEKGQLSNGKAREYMAQKVAMEVAALLQAGIEGTATIGDRALAPGDIAVLVRDRAEAAEIKAALAERYVNSVFLSRQSVFDSTVATELYHVLQAVLHPADERKLRSALATPLFGATMQELAALDEDVMALQALLDEFADYARHCTQHGVLSTLRRIMVRRDLPARLLAGEEGERCLTDLRHLGELLQQAGETTNGLHDLMRWYLRHLNGERREDSESQRVRLESDSKLVQIVTIHASKGLEFNIVFLPLASMSRRPAQYIYNEERVGGFVTVADLVGSQAGKQRADLERLAEDLRLLYVALTRARHHCWVGVANIKSHGAVLAAGDSALAHLLGLPRGALEETALLAGLKTAIDGAGEALMGLDDFGPRDITRAGVAWPTPSVVPLACPPLPRLELDEWHLTSYSALARGKTLPALKGGAGDEFDTAPLQQPADDTQFNPFTFPRGARYGTLLHNILEQVPFNCDRAVLAGATQRQLEDFGLSNEAWGDMVVDWLQGVLSQDLPPANGLRLQGLPEAARVSEMEFNFCLANTVNAGALGRILRQYGFLGEDASLSFADVTGVMRGFIDLVFEFQGQFYLLDYKSNHLGYTLECYDQAAMEHSIVEHQYDLQYLIYCVALHRYLAQRIATYSYDQHFGGVYYLFLRGMGQPGAAAGVFYDKPPASLIHTLDELFGTEVAN